MKLINNLPNHLKDKKGYLLNLKYRHITYLLLVLSLGNTDTMLRNVEKGKMLRKKKIRKKGQK